MIGRRRFAETEEEWMEEQLSLDFLRVVENAAIAAARTMGFGDRHHADEVAVEAMRKTMDSVEIDGTIVIGEGERDEAPMLYIGEKVGLATHAPKALFPQIDIAVDPLEGTNLCATGAPGAIAVLAASEKGGLLHAPDLYMEKLIVPQPCRDVVELDAPVSDNLRAIAKALSRDVDDLVITGGRSARSVTGTASLVMQPSPRQIRCIDSIHSRERHIVPIRF